MIAQAGGQSRQGVLDNLLKLLRLREASIAVVAVVIALIFWSKNAAFLEINEIQVLLAATATYGLIAVGEAMLMITGEIDLSAAKIFSTVPFVAYYLYDSHLDFWSIHLHVHMPLIIAVVLSLVVGALIGMVNGMLTVLLGLPSLISTLGMLFLLNGITISVSNSQPVRMPIAEPLNTFLGEGQQAPIGGAATYAGFLWLLAIVLVLTVILYRTRFGLHTISVGSNLLAAREIGIRTERTKIVNFMIMGLLAGLCGIIQAVSSSSIDPSAGDNSLTLYGIAAAVIGGTSLFGGSGTIIGALIGAFVISSLNNGLPLIGAQANSSDSILGLAIIGTMILNIRLSALRARRK